jgi:hypothetical protein
MRRLFIFPVTLVVSCLLSIVASGQQIQSARQATTLVEESHTVAASGSATAIALAQSPDPEFPVRCFVNGVLRRQGGDYQLSGQVLTFAPASAPRPGDSLSVYYKPAPKSGRGVDLGGQSQNPLIQTDLGAKSLHDTVALLLAQTAPTAWAQRSVRPLPSSRTLARAPQTESRAITRLKQRLAGGRGSDPTSGESRNPASFPNRPEAPETNNAAQKNESNSVRALKALLRRQQGSSAVETNP